jgi:hypothetical protein
MVTPFVKVKLMVYHLFSKHRILAMSMPDSLDLTSPLAALNGDETCERNDEESEEAARKAHFLIDYAKGNVASLREMVVQYDRKYRACGLKSLASFLAAVANIDLYPIDIRLIAAESLMSFQEETEQIEDSDSESLACIKKSCNIDVLARNEMRRQRGLNSLVRTMTDGINNANLSSLIKFNKAVQLVKNHRSEGIEFLHLIMDTPSLEPAYRFRLFHSALKNKQLQIGVALQCMVRILESVVFPTLFRILAAQTVLQNYREISDPSEGTRTVIFVQLEIFATDDGLDFGLRGDAADVLIEYGSEKYKEIARNVIRILGGTGNAFRNVYSDSQNVHVSSIEDSVRSSVDRLKRNTKDVILSWEDSTERIISISPDDSEWSSLCKLALQRIEFDSKVMCGLTLELLFRMIVSVVWKSNHASQLKKRLKEEFTEMINTCSSGYFSRLINVMSGFDGYSVQISFKDQIKAVITGRLNKKMKDIIASSTNGNHEFWTKRRYPIIYEWLKSQNLLNLSNGSNGSNGSNDEIMPPSSKTDAVDKWLQLNEQDWLEARELFCENILDDITSTRIFRPCFQLFQKYAAAQICEEVRVEFSDHLPSDVLDLHIRESLCFFEGH